MPIHPQILYSLAEVVGELPNQPDFTYMYNWSTGYISQNRDFDTILQNIIETILEWGQARDFFYLLLISRQNVLNKSCREWFLRPEIFRHIRENMFSRPIRPPTIYMSGTSVLASVGLDSQ